MTAEELADIDNLARALRLVYYNRRADDEEWGRLDLLSKNAWRRVANAHTTIKAQAQRIAELEAQLAARGPDREALCSLIRTAWDSWAPHRDKKTFDEVIADALLSSGALATAQAEQRPNNPTQEGEKL